MNILKLLEDKVIKALIAAGAPEDTPAMVRPAHGRTLVITSATP